jgi:hypothetical protein
MDNTINKPTEEDNFEISFRVLGNEFFGMKISSQSKAKNWAFFGLITLVAVTLLVNELGPAIVGMLNAVQ